MKKISFLFIAMIGFISFTIAQEKDENEKEVGYKGFHQLSFKLSHSIIGEGVVNGTNKSISAPSLGFDYNYWVQNKWAVGLQTDMITESFKIEDNGGALIERSTPVAVVPVISFKPINHSMFIVGLGKEYAKEGDFTLTRVGYEYSFELPKKYELSFGITYDHKWEAYEIWTFGIIVSKLFK
ncbi:MAG: hypothetical protein WCH78_09835 [Bacteroidota bacterium]